MSECVLPMFFSKNFIGYGLTFRSLIYFVFIFLCGVRKCFCLFACFFFGNRKTTALQCCIAAIQQCKSVIINLEAGRKEVGEAPS